MGRLEIERLGQSSARSLELVDGRMEIGRDASCFVQLVGRTIGRRHAVLQPGSGGCIEITCCHPKGIEINGAPLLRGQPPRALEPGAVIRIEDARLTWRVDDVDAHGTPDMVRAAELAYEAVVARLHGEVIDLLHRSGETPDRTRLLALIRNKLSDPGFGPSGGSERTCVRYSLLDGLMDRLLAVDGDEIARLALRPGAPQVEGLIRRLSLGLRKETLSEDLDRVQQEVPPAFDRLWPDIVPGTRAALACEHLVNTVADLVLDYGPLSRFLRLPDLEEIMVVTHRDIYVARHGLLERTGRTFASVESCLAVLERIVLRGGRRIDRSSPMVDVRLLDGSRVNAIIPPLALRGPCITIRRFPESVLTLKRLVGYGTLGAVPARFLEHCVQARLNILISGGTGSGKTTLLAALGAFCHRRDRVVTIEDTAELRLEHEHLVTLQAAPPNADGQGGATIRDLIRNALRMRPDRIIVGEVRGPEAFDMVQAMSTGHEGSLSTLHANSSAEAISRLQAMMAGVGGVDERLLRFQIGCAVDLIIQIHRFDDGRRRVTEITEVVRYDDRRDAVIVEPIYAWAEHAGALRFTGYVPALLERLLARTDADPEELLTWA